MHIYIYILSDRAFKKCILENLRQMQHLKKLIYSLICEVKGNHIGCSFSSRQGRKGGKRTNSMNRTKLPTC